MSQELASLDALVAAVVSSAKYKHISPTLVRAVGVKELAKGVSWKTAVKATKNKLHQIGGAYQPQRIDYDQALHQLQEARSPQEWRETSRSIMSLHTSTRERLPVLDTFYNTVLAEIPTPRIVLDVACGLNPLARPWMPLADDAIYIAHDIYEDMTQFLTAAMQTAGFVGRAETRDVLHDPPDDRADIAFLLKTLPCLDQLEKGAAARLLDTLQATYLLVSYPVSSLGGRHKGMVDTYDAQFQTLVSGRPWTVQRFLFETELAFLVHTQREKVNDGPAV